MDRKGMYFSWAERTKEICGVAGRGVGAEGNVGLEAVSDVSHDIIYTSYTSYMRL
jgi:hypothetical protein